jgi:dihydroflavonol-4-reductase
MNDLSHLEGATVLVTGATGFIGSHLVDSLLLFDCNVHCLVRKSSNLRWIKSSRVQLHFIDLADTDFKIPNLSSLDFVFHCAGLTKAKNRKEYFYINSTVCSSLYEQCLNYKDSIKGIVHLSSLAAAGPAKEGQWVDEATVLNPVTFYGQSKKEGEEVALKYSASLPIKVIRPPVVYGPREGNLYSFFKLVKKGWGLQIGRSPKKLSLLYVTDLVEAMIAVCDPQFSQKKIYFVTDGETYSWEEVAKAAAHKMNVSMKTALIPESILMPVAIFFEALAMLSTEPALFDRQRMIDIRQSCWTASSENFFRDYDFIPQFKLARGLACTLDWYVQQKWL